ncbi:tyrosine-type recombinase/integrase [Salaquimonas pukyongi]|uniref:tyrosine-type recombinase/integrase n=1 Tax=Salaquimonas pukyongi TaxID=2712698 RepID=UPI00096B806C|nr:tyrosine-type recombinase/integrase [Salaquimonas pukyongi]
MRRRTLPKHVTWAKDRHGKKRLRFRRKIGGVWQSRYLPGPVYSDDFNKAYQDALGDLEVAAIEPGASKTKSGTLNAAIVAYLSSAAYQNIRDSSKGAKRPIIEKIRTAHGDKRIVLLEPRHVQKLIDGMADRPHAANRWLSILRQILDHAVLIGMIRRNPAHGIKGYSKKSAGWRAWTEADIQQFTASHPIGTAERLAFDLLRYTGQRRSDVVKMGWQHVENGRLKFNQSKTGAPVDIRVPPELWASINSVPKRNLAFLLTSRGMPFTAAGFGNFFRAACDNAGLKNCSAHGLRKRMAKRLAESGATANQIKAVTGHTSLSEVARYTAAAESALLADQAFDLLSDTKTEQKVSQPKAVVGKKSGKCK